MSAEPIWAIASLLNADIPDEIMAIHPLYAWDVLSYRNHEYISFQQAVHAIIEQGLE